MKTTINIDKPRVGLVGLMLMLGLAAAGAGCSDDGGGAAAVLDAAAGGAAGGGDARVPDASADSDAAADTVGLGGPGGDAGGDAAQMPLYVITTGIISGDDFLGYLATVPNLEAGTTFDLSKAVGVGAGAWIFGHPGRPVVYVASLAEPTIVRWDVQPDGTLKKGPVLSFANLGLGRAYLAASAPIYSDEKSFFVDDDQDQVVIWNPNKMELIGAIPLKSGDQGALKPAPDGNIQVRPDAILVPVAWRDSKDYSLFGDRVRMVVIDPRSNAIVGATEDTRCSYLALSGEASDGTAYYSTYSYTAAQTVGGPGHGAKPCAMRVVPPATAFDQGYDVDLSKLAGGRPAGDLVLLDDKEALLRVWHPELVTPVTPTNWDDVVRGEAGFKWWRWKIGEAQAVELPNQQPGALGSSLFRMDGRTYVTRYAADGKSTALVEITESGEMKPALSGPGVFIGNGALRVR